MPGAVERFVDVAGLRPDVADRGPALDQRSASRPEVSVIVPTYRRPGELRRCLAGLAAQSLPPAEIIVVHRTGDDATRRVLEESRPAAVVDVAVSKPGVLAAMEAGAAASGRDIVAFVDDDAVPRPDWLERLARHFDDPEVGGVGGRDVIAGQDAPTRGSLKVGMITRWGKLVGNHHLGTGAHRDVMVLKAVGVAFRRDALALPHDLRGQGAQVHFEVGMSLSAHRRGWRLVYDPGALVDHEVAPRFDADARNRPRPVAVRDAAHNLVRCLLTEMPELFWRRAVYGLAVGDRDVPGAGRALVAALRGEGAVLRRFAPSIKGQVAALRRARRDRSGRCRCPAANGSPRRLRVALLAHDIHDNGGMERACLELLKRASQEVDFVVISSQLDPAVRSSVRWYRVPIPRRPFPLKFATFYLLAGVRLARESVDLVQTVGAIVPNRVDIASVHFCHAGFRAAGAAETSPASRLRRLNTRISHRLALVTERWSYRRDRVRLFAAVSAASSGSSVCFYPDVDAVVTPMASPETASARIPPHTDEPVRTIGVSSDECVALFVGGDWSRKGLGVAIGGLSRPVRGRLCGCGWSGPAIAAATRRWRRASASPTRSGSSDSVRTRSFFTGRLTSSCCRRSTRPSVSPLSRRRRAPPRGRSPRFTVSGTSSARTRPASS